MKLKNTSIFKLLIILPPVALAGSLETADSGKFLKSQQQTEANHSVEMTLRLNTTDQVIIIKGDPNLVPENIRSGVTIFGITGTFSGDGTQPPIQTSLPTQSLQAPKIPTLPTTSDHYTDNGNGTVTDNRSGLIWLKNANCFGKQNWKTAMQSADQLANGQCELTDDSRKHQWRLPTKEEWTAMMDKTYMFPALSNAVGNDNWTEGDAFTDVQTETGLYWSSSTNMEDKFVAWYANIGLGNVYDEHKSLKNAVWPVRKGQ